MISKKTARVFLFLLLFPAALNADFYNNRNVLVGERAALMGGAYTALSDDISGSYYNPAGLVYIDSAMLSINASIYRYQKASLRIKQETPLPFELNHDNTSLLFVPSSAGAAVKIGNAAIAFSIYQIDRFNVSSLGYVDYAAERRPAKFELDSVSYLMGPTAGYKFSNSFSAGVSCFYHYSSAEYTFAQGLPANETSNVLVMTKSGGLTGVFGIRAALSPGWNLGIMYGTETANLSGENNYTYSNTQTSYTIVKKTDGDIRLPHRTAMGISYEKKNSYVISLDAIYYFPMEYPAPYEISATEDHENNKHKERRHYDFSLGCELNITGKTALRAGLFTNTSGATKQNGQSRVNQYGGTLGLALITGEVITSIGANIMYGSSGYTKNYPSVGTDVRSSWERLSVSLVAGSTAKI